MIINFIARLIWVFFPFLRLHSVRYLGFAISFSALLIFLYLSAVYAPFFRKYIYSTILKISLIILKPKVFIFLFLIGLILYVKRLYESYSKKTNEKADYRNQYNSSYFTSVVLKNIEERKIYDIASHSDFNSTNFDERYKPEPYGLLPMKSFYSDSNFLVKNVKVSSKIKMVRFFFDLEEASLFNGIFNWWFLNFQNLIKIFYVLIFFLLVSGLSIWTIDDFFAYIGRFKRPSMYFGSFRLSKALTFLFYFLFMSFFSVAILTYLDIERSSRIDKAFRAFKRAYRSSWSVVLISFSACIFFAGVFRINTKKIFVTRRQFIFLKKHFRINKFIENSRLKKIIKKKLARNSYEIIGKNFLSILWRSNLVKRVKRFVDNLFLKTQLSDETPDWLKKNFKKGLKKIRSYVKDLYFNRKHSRKSSSKLKNRVFFLNKKRYYKKRRRHKRFKKRKKRLRRKGRRSGVIINKKFSLKDFLETYKPSKITYVNKHERALVRRIRKKAMKRRVKKKKRKYRGRKRRKKKRRGKRRRSKRKKKKRRKKRYKKKRKRTLKRLRANIFKGNETGGFISNVGGKIGSGQQHKTANLKNYLRNIKSATLFSMKLADSGVKSAKVDRFYKKFFNQNISFSGLNRRIYNNLKYPSSTKAFTDKTNFFIKFFNKVIDKTNSVIGLINKIVIPPLFYLPQDSYHRYFRKVKKGVKAKAPHKKKRISRRKKKKGRRIYSRTDRRRGAKDKHGRVGSEVRLNMHRTLDNYVDNFRNKVRKISGKYHNRFIETPGFLKNSISFNFAKIKKIDKDLFYNYIKSLPFLRFFFESYVKFKKFLQSLVFVKKDYINYRLIFKNLSANKNTNNEILFSRLSQTDKDFYTKEFEKYFQSNQFKNFLLSIRGIYCDLNIFSKAEYNYLKVAFCAFKGDKKKFHDLIIRKNYSVSVHYNVTLSKPSYFDTIRPDQSVENFLLEKLNEDLYSHDSFFRKLARIPKISNPFNFFSHWNSYRDEYWWYKLLFENVLGFDPSAYRKFVVHAKKLDFQKKNFDIDSLQKIYQENTHIKYQNILNREDRDTIPLPRSLLTPMDMSKLIRIIILKRFASKFLENEKKKV